VLAACAVVGGYSEAVRVGIIDYILSDAYKKVWEEYANGEWRRNFWKLWKLREEKGGRNCSDPLPEDVLSMDIWTLHY
jgi:hypothetical protein